MRLHILNEHDVAVHVPADLNEFARPAGPLQQIRVSAARTLSLVVLVKHKIVQEPILQM